MSGAFFVYSFDGRLLAEYNLSGQCIRDYIYFGGQLIAEYREFQPGHYFFYASDQINSTRIVTDSTGTIVYSAAHEPYGGIQKTWTSTYDPSLKFSGKQRDAESDLDYFGARYYDHSLYRFLSPDRAIISGGARFDSQRWNLYVYCGNNPMKYVDSNGNTYIIFIKQEQKLYIYDSDNYLSGIIAFIQVEIWTLTWPGGGTGCMLPTAALGRQGMR